MIIESVLNIGTHQKQAIALQYTSSRHRLFKQESFCGYFWKVTALETLNNKNKMIKLVKVIVNSVNHGRLSDGGNFMYDVYLPSLQKYIYHVHYIQIISKNYCGKLRQNTCYSKPGNILSIKDYIERMSANFNLEIQSVHFRNGRSISIEGCMIDIVDQDLNGYMEFLSHFSDDSRQDSSTTHAHIVSILTELRNNNQLKQRYNIWESLDGGCKQYLCGAVLLFCL